MVVVAWLFGVLCGMGLMVLTERKMMRRAVDQRPVGAARVRT